MFDNGGKMIARQLPCPLLPAHASLPVPAYLSQLVPVSSRVSTAPAAGIVFAHTLAIDSGNQNVLEGCYHWWVQTSHKFDVTGVGSPCTCVY